MSNSSKPQVAVGLENVVAATTRLSKVDGLAGRLIIAGMKVEDLAPAAGFEEVLYLLWFQRLPSEEERGALTVQLAKRRHVPEAALTLLRHAAAADLDPMDALLMAVPSLALHFRGADPREIAIGVIAAMPTLVAAYQRLCSGLEPVQPDKNLAHVANFLYMLHGEKPNAATVRGLETYLNTVVDHGLNASTFTARVIISTGSDMVSAVVGALGALKGPLHGGAPGPALDMVFAIGSPERAEPTIRARLAAGERLMGFGHRVYKVRDPRAEVLAGAAERFFQSEGDRALFQLAGVVEQTAVRLLAEYKPGRKLETNVEFYTALLLHGLGMPKQLFTPIFAMGRVAGWTAHCFEQIEAARLIRPKALYVGPDVD